jgi:hypothetical protein
VRPAPISSAAVAPCSPADSRQRQKFSGRHNCSESAEARTDEAGSKAALIGEPAYRDARSRDIDGAGTDAADDGCDIETGKALRRGIDEPGGADAETAE